MTTFIQKRHYLLGLSEELSLKAFVSNDVDLSAEARLKLYPSGALSSARDTAQEELFFCRNKLVWSCEGRVRMKVACKRDISDATICRFSEEPCGDVLCVADATSLAMYNLEGDVQEHPLLHAPHRLWAIPPGLLIEAPPGAAAQMMTHSLTGMEPVCTTGCGSSAGGKQSWENESVVWASPDLPIVVTTSAAADTYSLWCLKAFPDSSFVGSASGDAGAASRHSPFGSGRGGAAATPATPMSTGRSRIRGDDDTIQPFVFTAFRSGNVPPSVSSVCFPSVSLPADRVKLAFDLVCSEPLEGGAMLVDATMVQALDGCPVIVLLDSLGRLLLYLIDVANGNAVRQAGERGGVMSMASISLPWDPPASECPTQPPDDRHLRCLITLKRDGVWLWRGLAPLLLLSVAPEAAVLPEQVLHFPQPPLRPPLHDPAAGGPAAADADADPIFAPSSTDNQFSQGLGPDEATPPAKLVADMGPCVGVTHACANTFLMHFACGANVQVVVDLAPFCELVCACFAALEAVMAPPDFDTMIRSMHKRVRATACADADWRAFSDFITTFWRGQLASAVTADPAHMLQRLVDLSARPVGSTGDDTWDAFAALPSTRAILSQRLYPGLLQDDESGDDAAAAPRSHQAPRATISGLGRNVAANILCALHSVYEDLKLNTLHWQHVPRMAVLLLHLSSHIGADDWSECYLKSVTGAMADDQLLPEASLATIAALDPPLDAPPDMMCALLERVSGSPRGSGALPLLVQRQSAAVRRSVELLSLYRVLGRSLEDCSQLMITNASDHALAEAHEAGSVALVKQLGALGWGLHDLETLPFGIAAPIHQALRCLQQRPPPTLTPAEFILIGREDLAVTLESLDALRPPEPPQPSTRADTPAPLGRKSASRRVLFTDSPRAGGGESGRAPPSGPREVVPVVSTPASVTRSSPAAAWPTSPAGTPVAGLRTATLADVWKSRKVLGHAYAQRLGLPGPLPEPPPPTSGASQASAADDPGDRLNDPLFRMRFGQDLRLLEVQRLLCYTRPVTLRAAPEPEPGPLVQARLQLHAARTLALPFGRGALTLGTLHLLPTEPLVIPKPVLSGTMPHANNSVAPFDMSHVGQAPGGGADNELTAWPEFHAGVASTLRIVPSGTQLVHNWIVFNKPPPPSYAHAGMLLALGLTGDLTSLSNPNIFRYLSQEHPAVMVGLLLGMAASFKGSMDDTMSKTLNMHVPLRQCGMFSEVEVSPLTQAAALVGLGLLYQGSGHPDSSEMLLSEIGRRPSNLPPQGSGQAANNNVEHSGIIPQDRESFALSAGFGLGLVNLGRGHGSSGAPNGNIVERLKRLIVGSGLNNRHAQIHRGGSNPLEVPGAPWHPSCLWRSEAAAAKLPSDDLAPSHGLSQVVLEGNLVNLEVTSPAATLALTLMFLKTNDAAVADILALPDTTFNLDFVSPSSILLRVLARSLIMWDSVQPSREWLLTQMPPILRTTWPESLERIKADIADGNVYDHEAVLLGHLHAVGGGCLALGLRFAGTANEGARQTLEGMLLYLLRCRKTLLEIKAEVAGLGLDVVVLERVVGVCAMALGAVMAGMGHLKTLQLLRALRKRLLITENPIGTGALTNGSYGVHMAVSMAIGFLFLGGASHTFGTSLADVSALLISMWPTLPQGPSDNRCHLQPLRHLYALAATKRMVHAIDVNVRLPVYVPIEMGVLGSHEAGGAPHPLSDENRPSNRQDPLCSPPLPGTSNATPKPPALRLEPLGGKARGFALDGMHGSGGGALATGDQTATSSAVLKRTCPCLLPDQSSLQLIQVSGERYWPQGLDGATNPALMDALYRRCVLFVKKRARALSYQDDPTGVRSLLSSRYSSQSGLLVGVQPNCDLLHICSTLSSDPFVTSFALTFCGDGRPSSREGSHQAPERVPVGPSVAAAAAGVAPQLNAAPTHDVRAFLRSALSECVLQEKPHLLPTYVLLFCAVQALGSAWALQDQQNQPEEQPEPSVGSGRGTATTTTPPRRGRRRAGGGSPASTGVRSPDPVEPPRDAVASATTHSGWGSAALTGGAGPALFLRNLEAALAFAESPLARAAACAPSDGASALTQPLLHPAFLLASQHQLFKELAALRVLRPQPGPTPETSSLLAATERGQGHVAAMDVESQAADPLDDGSSVVRESYRAGRLLSALEVRALLPGASESDRRWVRALAAAVLDQQQAGPLRSVRDAIQGSLPALRALDLGEEECLAAVSGMTGLSVDVAREIL